MPRYKYLQIAGQCVAGHRAPRPHVHVAQQRRVVLHVVWDQGQRRLYLLHGRAEGYTLTLVIGRPECMHQVWRHLAQLSLQAMLALPKGDQCFRHADHLPTQWTALLDARCRRLQANLLVACAQKQDGNLWHGSSEYAGNEVHDDVKLPRVQLALHKWNLHHQLICVPFLLLMVLLGGHPHMEQVHAEGLHNGTQATRLALGDCETSTGCPRGRFHSTTIAAVAAI
mmetsp:Transcript_8885/g.23956  ORF Transcript_8885/g.23956 Transcript_8885/m.23956 type:complete len:226 (-) Transcript_8885:4907-5584(-)